MYFGPEKASWANTFTHITCIIITFIMHVNWELPPVRWRYRPSGRSFHTGESGPAPENGHTRAGLAGEDAGYLLTGWCQPAKPPCPPRPIPRRPLCPRQRLFGPTRCSNRFHGLEPAHGRWDIGAMHVSQSAAPTRYSDCPSWAGSSATCKREDQTNTRTGARRRAPSPP